jgi:hypothetical protein
MKAIKAWAIVNEKGNIPRTSFRMMIYKSRLHAEAVLAGGSGKVIRVEIREVKGVGK